MLIGIWLLWGGGFRLPYTLNFSLGSTTFYQNGVEIAGGRRAHTIMLKVLLGTVKIDEFWTI